MRGKKKFMQKEENMLAIGKCRDKLPSSTFLADGMKNKKCSNLNVSFSQSHGGNRYGRFVQFIKCHRMLEV